MKNYFEQDIKVKCIDGILSKLQDWQWLVDYIENNFDLSDITDWKDFEDKLSSVNDILIYFNHITNIKHKKITFNKNLLQDIYYLSEYLMGNISKRDVQQVVLNNFSKILFLIIWITKLENQDNSCNYLVDKSIFKMRNLGELIKINSILLHKNEIIKYINNIKIKDICKIKNCILDNLNEKHFSYKKSFLKRHKKQFINANAFNMQFSKEKTSLTWQEEYLLDMIKISIRNRKIIPLMEFNNIQTPNISLWTKPILKQLKIYFDNNISALFIIETIAYLLYNESPSKEVILLHCKLLSKYLKNKDRFFDCSSFKILSYLFEDKKMGNYSKELELKNLLKLFSKIKDIKIIVSLQNKKIPISEKQKKKLKDFYISEYKAIEKINDINSYENYIKNKNITKQINKKYFDKVCEKFYQFANTDISILTGQLFYDFMNFLLATKQHNSELNKIEVEFKIIEIHNLWKTKYYKKVQKTLHSLTATTKLPTQTVIDLNKSIISCPQTIVTQYISSNIDNIIRKMQISSENPIHLLCTQIDINENFPIVLDYKNSKIKTIDEMLIKIINKIKENWGYKFLNVLDTEIYFCDLHKQWIYYAQFYTSLFNEHKKLYNIIEQNSNINLIPYNENLSLAHLTQLFPLLEFKIRDLAKCLGIVYLNESEKDFMKYKDPSSILAEILERIYNEIGSFEIADDIFFVYNYMYNSNSLNIRNECIHGRKYLEGNSLEFAFKLTLISLYLIIYRINVITQKCNTTA